MRTPFQRDRDRIVHSKAFRRLKHKTQVFVAPEGDHYRTRLTHTLEACFISRTVARALGLNEDLTEAIGLGHDLGHPPFGHIGEEVLDAALQEHGMRFRHNEHSLRVVEVLARDGRGLNLTQQVGTASSTTRGPGSPPRWRGGWCGSSTGSRTSTTTSTTRCARGSSRMGICRARRSSCSARRVRAGSTCSSRTWSSGPGRRGTSRRATRSGARCCGCGSSCSSACTWGRRLVRSRSGRGWRCGRCSTTTSHTSMRCPRPTLMPVRCSASRTTSPE